MSESEVLARALIMGETGAQEKFLSLIREELAIKSEGDFTNLASVLFALRMLNPQFPKSQMAGQAAWEAIKIMVETYNQPGEMIKPRPNHLAGLMVVLALYQPIALTGAVQKIGSLLSPSVYLETIINLRGNYLYLRDGQL